MAKKIICYDNGNHSLEMAKITVDADNYIITQSVEDSIKYINEECEFYFYNIESLYGNVELIDQDPAIIITNYLVLHSVNQNPIIFLNSRAFNSDVLHSYINRLYGSDNASREKLMFLLAIILNVYTLTKADLYAEFINNQKHEDEIVEDVDIFISRSEKDEAIRKFILDQSKNFFGDKKDKDIIKSLKISKATYYRIKKQINDELMEQSENC